MVWTLNRIKRSKDRAGEAQGRIRDLFTHGVIQIDSNRYAWGQFLDEPKDNTQYGIYGTSAGVQVLLSAGYPPDHEIISGACRILREALDVEENLFRTKGDLVVLYKLAYLAEAFQPQEKFIDGNCRPMTEIISRLLPQQGWGEYFISQTQRDIHPKVVATVAALFSLRRYRPFRSMKECEESLRWLCNRVLQNGDFRAHEVAFVALALAEYRSPGVNLPDYKRTLDFCGERLVDWAKSRKKKEFGESNAHYFWTPVENRRLNRYLFFLPDCLVPLALLKLDYQNKVRSYLPRVIDSFARLIISQGGFTPNLTRRVSAVDHLWIYRLLEEYRSRSPDQLKPPSWCQWRVASWARRIVFLLFFLSLAATGSYIAYAAHDIYYRVAGGIMSGLGLTLLGRGIWDFFAKDGNGRL